MYARVSRPIDPEDFFSDQLTGLTGEEYTKTLETLIHQKLANGEWVDDLGEQYYDNWEILDDDDLKCLFAQYINEDARNKVAICGFKYDPAKALANLDPAAYQTAFDDWIKNDFMQWTDEPVIEI